MNKVLIVIPAYNEEANIEMVVRELEEGYPQFDYLVVNDKVSEAAGEIIAILTAESCRTKHRINLVEGV